MFRNRPLARFIYITGAGIAIIGDGIRIEDRAHTAVGFVVAAAGLFYLGRHLTGANSPLRKPGL